MPVPVIAEVRNTLTGSPTMEIGSDVEGQALQRAVDAFNAGDLSTYLRLYDMSCVFHGYGPEDLDLDGARAFYTGVLGAFPDAWLDLDDIVRDGEKACIRFHLTATQQGEFMGVPPTGRPIRLEGQTIMCFRNGRVVERWQSADMLSLMVQLGAVPAPA
jgi:predicted ester cyclase